MKKLLLVLLVAAATFAAKAQTEEKTLEWLNANKKDIDIYNSWITLPLLGDGYDVHGKTLEINSGDMKFTENNDTVTTVKWGDIFNVEDGGKYLLIISCYRTSDHKVILFTICFINNGVRDKYIKNLLHMASLKGAKIEK